MTQICAGSFLSHCAATLRRIPKPGHLQTRGFCVHPGSLDPFNRRHSRAAGHLAWRSPSAASECLFHFPNRRESYVSSRFLHRTQRRRARPVRAYVRRHHHVRTSPVNGRRPRSHRHHNSRLEVLRMSNGFFFGLVILPAMAAATLYHWIFD